jgi:List-Bact-rpt repeat protein
MRAMGWACLGALSFAACGPTDSGNGGPGARALTIHMGGTGFGAVRSSSPAIDCSAQCTQSIAANAKVQLTAAPATGSTFAGWQGACSGADCSVTMDADRDVTATFTSGQSAHVTVAFPGKGSGRVTSTPPGIDCPGICTMVVPPVYATVALSAQADSNSSFVGWGGACTGDGVCAVTASGDQTAWANFDVKASPPPPPASCAGISPPDEIAMQQFVHQQDTRWYTCLPGLGDGNGTMAFPRAYNDPNSHGSQLEFVNKTGAHLSDEFDVSESIKPFQQPRGTIVPGDAGHLRPVQEMILIRSWDSFGKAAGDVNLRAQNFAPAPDPSGGILLAGDLSLAVFGALSHAAVMYTGGGTAPQLRWGPKALASAGAVYGAGVDLLGRALVITNGEKFGPATISAQWFDRDGAALTGEFVLVTGFTAGESTWFETSPLIGSGLMVRRMDYSYAQPGIFHARALAVVDSGQPSVRPPLDWMVSRPDTRLQIARNGRGYAVLPYGAKGVTCSQRIEVLGSDGASCGARDYPIAAGTCDTHDLALGEDGTVIQLLPDAMETKDPVIMTHTCTWRWWAGALR